VFAAIQAGAVACCCVPLQACKAAAAAVELAAENPWAYHASDSSSYCHWLPTHAATFLQSHIQLGYRPSDTVVNAILTALMLHWEFKQAQQEDKQAGATALQLLQSQDQAPGWRAQQDRISLLSQQHQVQLQQQQHGHQQQQESARKQHHEVAGDEQQQREQLQDVVQVLAALAQLGHQPGPRVSCHLQTLHICSSIFE
jgi:hypothetical protein